MRYCQCKVQSATSAKIPIGCCDLATLQLGTEKGGAFITIKIRNQEEFFTFLNFMCAEFIPHATALEVFLEIKSDLAIHLPYGEIDFATIRYRTDTVNVSLVFKDSRFSVFPPASYTIKYQFEI